MRNGSWSGRFGDILPIGNALWIGCHRKKILHVTKFRSYGELGLGAKAQVRPRSWTKILAESWPSAGPSPRAGLLISREGASQSVVDLLLFCRSLVLSIFWKLSISWLFVLFRSLSFFLSISWIRSCILYFICRSLLFFVDLLNSILYLIFFLSNSSFFVDLFNSILYPVFFLSISNFFVDLYKFDLVTPCCLCVRVPLLHCPFLCVA